MSVNKVILIGYAGKDPEFRSTDTLQVASFSLATTERYKGEEATEWHNIKAFGKTAEIINRYVRKGSQVYIEGKIKSRSYADSKGETKYITEIVVDNLQLLDKAPESAPQRQQERPAGTAKAEPQNYSDDLPF